MPKISKVNFKLSNANLEPCKVGDDKDTYHYELVKYQMVEINQSSHKLGPTAEKEVAVLTALRIQSSRIASI